MLDPVCDVKYCAFPATLSNRSWSVIDVSDLPHFLIRCGATDSDWWCRIEYLIPTYNILVLLLHSNVTQNLALLGLLLHTLIEKIVQIWLNFVTIGYTQLTLQVMSLIFI